MTPPAPLVQEARNKVWWNWHETEKQKVARQVAIWNGVPNRPTIAGYNATTAVLQRLIGEAVRDGMELRAAGGKWSFSPVAVTDGILINTQPLNYRFWPTDTDLDVAWHGRGDELVFAQCGMSIAELNFALHARGRSLPTSGASNGQTIAGAIATGTHGSAIDHGGLQDSVLGLHLITSPDTQLWLERAGAQVASDAFLAQLGATRVADDALFDAAVVGLGSMGVVHGVMLASVPLFWLEAFRSQEAGSAAVWAAIEQLDFIGIGPRPGVRPYFFQAIVNPYDVAGGPYLTRMYANAVDPGGPRPQHHDKWRAGDSAAEVVAGLIDALGGTPKKLGQVLMRQYCPDISGECGRWGDLFWDTSTRGKSAGMALGIPADRTREAVEALLDLNKQFKIPGVLALRFVRASRGTLAFTRHAPVTCVLDIDGTLSKGMERFQEAAWRRLQALGIPFTFHWGKLQPVVPGLVQQMYGQAAVDAWRAARAQLLPTPALRQVFSNAWLRGVGLG